MQVERPRPLANVLVFALYLAVFSVAAAEPADEQWGEPLRTKTARLLAEDRFNQLEEIATRLRTEKSQFSDGWWKLPWYYSGVNYPPFVFHEGSYEEHIKRLQRWISAKPKSVTPRVALAHLYIFYAWYARGGGWSPEVKEENWKTFRDRLALSRQTLLESESMAIDQGDPEWFVLRLLLERAAKHENEQKFRKDVYEPLFRRAIEMSPTYHRLYLEKATYLLPRWHGKLGELEQFAEEAAGMTKSFEGDGLYTRIAMEAPVEKTGNPFADYGLSWNRVQQGFWDLVQRYPQGAGLFTNQCCWYACVAQDQKTAASLFDSIGTNINTRVWQEKETFDSWRKWAKENGERPALGELADAELVRKAELEVAEANKEGDSARAKRLNQLIVKHRPKYHWHWHNLAFNYFVEKDYTNALAASKRAIEFQARPERYGLLGDIYASVGDLRNASEATTEAIKLGANFERCWQILEQAYTELHEPELAKRQLTEILQAQPNTTRAKQLLQKYGH